MSCPFQFDGPKASRRGLFAAAGGLLAAAAPVLRPARATEPAATEPPDTAIEPFYGAHQGGIATSQQTHLYFVALDCTARKPEDLIALLQAWTKAAARLTRGQPAQPIGDDLSVAAGDGGDALGLSPARLTLTFGFGPDLFRKDGRDRYGLAARMPDALTPLPKFNGDQLEPARSGGDLSIQACADDPQVAFHAVRELVRIGYGQVLLRWGQSGFLPNTKPGQTARNLMGFKDGTNNARPGEPPTPDRPRRFEDVVWAGDDGPAWMRGGSYLVARRIRISLEHWDRTEIDFQEEVIGRHKYSGAPIGRDDEFDALGLDRVAENGDPVIPETAHVRLGAAAMNDGAQIHRRAYSYNDGVAFTAERWPPWRQGMLVDAGLFFVAYQRDPRTGFTPMFDQMARLDALNQFTTHTSSAVFACPPGVRAGDFIGSSLFAQAG